MSALLDQATGSISRRRITVFLLDWPAELESLLE